MEDAGQARRGSRMIDNFALALSHGLIILTAWRLLSRPDLDDDSAKPEAPKPSFLKRRGSR